MADQQKGTFNKGEIFPMKSPSTMATNLKLKMYKGGLTSANFVQYLLYTTKEKFYLSNFKYRTRFICPRIQNVEEIYIFFYLSVFAKSWQASRVCYLRKMRRSNERNKEVAKEMLASPFAVSATRSRLLTRKSADLRIIHKG